MLTLVPATLLLSWQSVTAQAAAAMGTPMTMVQYMAPDYGAHVIAGLPFWPLKTAVSTLVVVPGMLPGILFQSAVWVALFYPFTLDLRDDMGFAASCAVAAGIWIASILLADGMRRAGYRGPAEAMLRRLPHRRSEPASASSGPRR
ncbi:DUF418 domain-containing protein [Sorangium sp. So ce854]|uniref:DUF418 domain-containing protein n=1 Tax=Sorangium sp. So ce854 TaxID=3133322 RepID=UPI003F62C191